MAVSSCNSCDNACGSYKPSLFDKFKGLFGRKGHGCCQCAPSCDSGCAAPGCSSAHPAPAHPAPAHPAPANQHPAPVHVSPALPLPGHPAPMVLPSNPLPHGNPKPVVNPAPIKVVPIQPAPGTKNAEPIKKPPVEDKTQPKKDKKEDARFAPAPVVTPAAAKIETEIKNPF